MSYHRTNIPSPVSSGRSATKRAHHPQDYHFGRSPSVASSSHPDEIPESNEGVQIRPGGKGRAQVYRLSPAREADHSDWRADVSESEESDNASRPPAPHHRKHTPRRNRVSRHGHGSRTSHHSGSQNTDQFATVPFHQAPPFFDSSTGQPASYTPSAMSDFAGPQAGLSLNTFSHDFETSMNPFNQQAHMIYPAPPLPLYPTMAPSSYAQPPLASPGPAPQWSSPSEDSNISQKFEYAMKSVASAFHSLGVQEGRQNILQSEEYATLFTSAHPRWDDRPESNTDSCELLNPKCGYDC